MGGTVAAFALLSVGIARETQFRNRGLLLVASSMTPSMGGDYVLSMRVIVADPNDRDPIRNVRLRISQKNAREGDVQIVSPPASVQDMGSGRYFIWGEMASNQTIEVRLHPRHTTKLTLIADGFNSYNLDLSPAVMTPLDLRANRSH